MLYGHLCSSESEWALLIVWRRAVNLMTEKELWRDRETKKEKRVDYATLVTKPGKYPNEDTQVRFFPYTETQTQRLGYEKVQKYYLLNKDKILVGKTIRHNHNHHTITIKDYQDSWLPEAGRASARLYQRQRWSRSTHTCTILHTHTCTPTSTKINHYGL